jgi:hypothetical protein
MSKGVHKHCSVLNYIRHVDNKLYDVIQDLCIGRMFVPRKGSPGITFLRPDASLLKEIKDMAEGDSPEDAVEAIQALLLLDNISSISEFDNKKSDIPTYLRQKLPITSVDGKKVVLSNGAEIHPDKDFEARKDRGNICVYVLSKALVPTQTQDADFSNAKVGSKAKKGGADLSVGRSQIFETIIDQMCAGKTEPAMELLYELYFYFSTANAEIAKLIASQCSFDALASLAIVLQPYKVGGVQYISDADLAGFASKMYQLDANYQASPDVWSLDRNVLSEYAKLCTGGFDDAAKSLQSVSSSYSETVAKLNIISKVGKAFDALSKSSHHYPAARAGLSNHEKFAEAELRVMSAILFDNASQAPSADELKALFANCKLNKPYMCDDRSLVEKSNIGFYFSTIYLIIRSDALMYVPNTLDGVGLDQIYNESKFMNINAYMESQRKQYRQATHDKVLGLHGRLRLEI